jgi:hypothetical protein
MQTEVMDVSKWAIAVAVMCVGSVVLRREVLVMGSQSHFFWFSVDFGLRGDVVTGIVFSL